MTEVTVQLDAVTKALATFGASVGVAASRQVRAFALTLDRPAMRRVFPRGKRSGRALQRQLYPMPSKAIASRGGRR